MTSMTEQRIADYNRLAREGKNAAAIAADMGIQVNTLYQFIHRTGLKTPSEIMGKQPVAPTMTREEYEELLRSGAGSDEIAKAMGINRGNLYYHLARLRFPNPREWRAVNKVKLTSQQAKRGPTSVLASMTFTDYQQRVMAGQNVPAIAAEFGVQPGTVYGFIARNKWPTVLDIRRSKGLTKSSFKKVRSPEGEAMLRDQTMLAGKLAGKTFAELAKEYNLAEDEVEATVAKEAAKFRANLDAAIDAATGMLSR